MILAGSMLPRGSMPLLVRNTSISLWIFAEKKSEGDDLIIQFPRNSEVTSAMCDVVQRKFVLNPSGYCEEKSFYPKILRVRFQMIVMCDLSSS